ncbi:1,4-dihydroxy-2-naphthoyl-CoA hydrolase [Actimicrobium sp. GrIS 1.19]|uniref:PaaI family thioesterase n=1 Tax=Actimicrobium sp. GrIS 1.19 TaxID=3071708 RepID=UPI002E0C38B5|nr:1,4-dihydroxy-2-naphthoyl-CoA hydrolase [Actimicrobium sp. GrIS 1.19]
MNTLPSSPAEFNAFQKGSLPGFLGVEIDRIDATGVHARLAIEPHHHAPNGYLHAATVVMLADTCCGYGCIARLPEGAKGFTTIELKSNHLGTATSGVISCVATPAHLGRNTHVWDATVSGPDGKVIALFRCTQMVLWPR